MVLPQRAMSCPGWQQSAHARKESPVQVVLPERTAPSQMMASYR